MSRNALAVSMPSAFSLRAVARPTPHILNRERLHHIVPGILIAEIGHSVETRILFRDRIGELRQGLRLSNPHACRDRGPQPNLFPHRAGMRHEVAIFEPAQVKEGLVYRVYL
jgi:hypothetical protein